MTVILQRILVPENRRITLELPSDVPAGGTADIVVTISAPQKERAVPPKKRIGILAGKLHVPDDFDAALPDEILRAFAGEE